MNIFKRLYCRTFQTVFKLALPILPYREPEIVKTNDEIVNILKNNNIDSVIMITDKGIRGIGLTKEIEDKITHSGVKLTIYENVVPNPTTDNVDEALNMYNQNGCKAIIAFGGGSVLDCAKATGARVVKPKKSLAKMKGILKVRKRLPIIIAVPTTAGTGSETTLAAVITDSKTRHKYAINDFPLIPRYAMLNASLTIGLPAHITATTGMDALTHAIEAYIGRSTTKQTRKCALYAIKTIFENLIECYNNPTNLKARENMLLASYNAGLAFTKSYVGYVHAVAHSLGGKYNIPHGLANAIILPYILRKFGRKIYKKLWEIGVYSELFDKSVSKEVGAKIIIEKIEDLNRLMNIGTQIDEIIEKDIPELAKTAEHEANPLYPVPVLFTARQLEEVYYEVKNG